MTNVAVMITLKISTVLVFLMIQEVNAIAEYTQTECKDKFGMASGEIKDDQISASTFHGYYRPEKGRFHGDSAWCVSGNNGEAKGAFLEVDLGEIRKMTWLGIQGFGDGYVSNFTIEYKRRKTEGHWRKFVERLPFNTSSIVTFQGNSDNTTHKFIKFKGSRILRYLRIVLVHGVGKKWCLKLELYGCQWKNKDGLVSYQAAQGNVRGLNTTALTLNDVTYDGILEHYGRRYGALRGGLGQLTDGDIGGDAFWLNVGNGKSFEWVGWYDIINLSPSILFEFETPREFHKIFLHGNNRPGNVRVFRNLMVAFSIDGSYYSRKFVFYPNHLTPRHRNQSLWIEVDLQGHVGKYLNCEFSYEGKWIVLSEIEFESEKFTGVLLSNDTGATTPMIYSNETQANTPSMKPVERRPIETKSILSVHAIIAMAIVGAALLLFTVVFIIWLTRIHEEEGEDGTYPMRNVNRIVNSLKRVSLQKKDRPKYYSSSSDSDDDIDDLMERKVNKASPSNQPWYKSLDKHKMNNMNFMNNLKSWASDEEMESEEKKLNNLQLNV